MDFSNEKKMWIGDYPKSYLKENFPTFANLNTDEEFD